MLNRDNIHNGAMLDPRFTKCASFSRFKKHAYAMMDDGRREQCLDCGKIKPAKKDYNHGLH